MPCPEPPPCAEPPPHPAVPVREAALGVVLAAASCCAEMALLLVEEGVLPRLLYMLLLPRGKRLTELRAGAATSLLQLTSYTSEPGLAQKIGQACDLSEVGGLHI